MIGTTVCDVVGGILGALVRGSATSAGSKYLLDGLIEDDAKQMVDQLPSCLEPLCTDFLLSADETNALADVVRARIDAPSLRLMY